MTTKTFFKRAVAFLLVAIMLFGMIPATVLAETTNENPLMDILTGWVNKTNNGLDENDQTDVTLTVPGMTDSLGMDIVYIMGGRISKQAAESDVKIQNLKEVIAAAIAQGTPVNFGIVTYSHRLPIGLPLTKFATEEDLANFTQIIEDSFNRYGEVDGWSDGGGNMEQALTNAKNMLSDSNNPLKDYPERQHIVLYSSGQTYEFNDGENNEYSACAPAYTNGSMYWSGSNWSYIRNGGSSRYYIPTAIVETYKENKDQYTSDWDCYWSYITKWVEADRLDEASENPQKSHVYRYYKYGDPIDTAFHLTTEQMQKYPNIANKTTISKTDLATANAIVYERAMYEAYEYAKPNIIDAGINLHAIYNPINANYINGAYNRNYVGHCFMDMLAGGEGKAAIYQSSNEFYFESVEAQILYTTSKNSRVEDYIGYNENGNFEFITTNPEYIKLTVGGVEYKTVVVETKEGATLSLAFKASEEAEATFWLDYYYGDGKDTEKFIWTFGEDVSLARPASLTYKLQLTEKIDDLGKCEVPTNLSATLYPVNSEGVEGEAQEFPVPTVTYEKIIISGSKTWADDDNNDGIRPESITINLKENGEIIATKEVSEADNWQWTFEVYKKENAQYTIEEVAVDGYTPEYDDNFNVINKHENEQIVILGSKNWDDVNDADAIRPDSITVNLLVNDEVVDTKTVTAEDGWTWSFVVDKYEDGEEIEYTISEDEVDGYTTEISGSVADGFVITNTHVPTIDITVNKTWDDEDNVDGIRPESITVNLLANGEVVATQVITAEDGWTYTFAGLVKYNENGEEIVYTISEDEVDGYETTIDGFEITNTHIPTILEDPEIPEGPGPATGGAATLFGWFTLAIASGALALTMLFSEKKRLANSK